MCEGRPEVINVCDVNGQRGVVGQSVDHRLLHGTNKGTEKVSVGAVAATPTARHSVPAAVQSLSVDVGWVANVTAVPSTVSFA